MQIEHHRAWMLVRLLVAKRLISHFLEAEAGGRDSLDIHAHKIKLLNEMRNASMWRMSSKQKSLMRDKWPKNFPQKTFDRIFS